MVAGFLCGNAAVVSRAADSVAAPKNETEAAALRTRFLNETNIASRREILKALAGTRNEASVEIVVGLLSATNRNSELFPDALDAAGSVSSIYVTSALIDLSKASLPTNLLARTLEVLGNKGSTDGLAALAPHLRSPDSRVRQAAAAGLAKGRGHPGINLILPYLNDPSVETRRAAVGALGHYRHGRVVPYLLKAYADPATREEARLALANVPSADAIEAYLGGLSLRDTNTVHVCQQAIQKISADVLPAIEARTAHLFPETLARLREVYAHDEKARQGPLFQSIPPAK